ncbi:MAG: glycolate oxidase subunit GlcE [Gammaproteobacteria bacterium]
MECQILPCEPPYFGAKATLGGMVASGLSGCRRVNAGNVRDCVLGTVILNGKGEQLRFGGKVMKNVAGYDLSRLMCGALGTLGVLMSISIRLLPKPKSEQTIVLTLDRSAAIKKMNQWANTPMPISATFYDGNDLYIRLSSSFSAVDACKKEIGGESLDKSDLFWTEIKEHSHKFFVSDEPIWRLSVPPSTETMNISGECVFEWNGALRWYRSEANEKTIRSAVNQVGGHANLFRGNTTENIFHPLSEATMTIHRNLKHVLDPAGILNPGRMFAEL